jgi:outer membrane protein TolC
LNWSAATFGRIKTAAANAKIALDVLVAQDAAFRARLNYATAIVRYNQAEVNLLAALGLIDEANVKANSRGRTPSRRH